MIFNTRFFVLLCLICTFGCRIKDKKFINNSSVSQLSIQANLKDQKTSQLLTTLKNGTLNQAQCGHQVLKLNSSQILLIPDTGTNSLADPEVLDTNLFSWNSLAPMNVQRTSAGISRLNDGRILVSGGADDSSEIFNPNLGLWLPGPNLKSGARMGHMSVALNDGRVLITGGSINITGEFALTTEIFSPNLSEWTLSSSIQTGRTDAKAIVLNDGRVMLIGGADLNGTPISSVEIFDPQIGSWSVANSLNTPRADFSVVKLSNGKILVLGGFDDNWASLNTSEVFDPQTNVWTFLPNSFLYSRAYLNSILIDPTHVIIFGGSNDLGTIVDQAEILDLNTNQWAIGGTQVIPRQRGSAELLEDGSILLVAGCNSSGIATLSSELWNPLTKEWRIIGGLPRSRLNAILMPLEKNKVLLAGGQFNVYPQKRTSSSIIIDGVTGQSVSTGPMVQTRNNAYSITLLDGRILAISGQNNINQWLLSSEIFDPVLKIWTASGDLQTNHGAGANVILLNNGKVLFSGGISNGIYLNTIEIFDPIANTWSLVAPMLSTRAYHQNALLKDGNVLVIAGRNTSLLATTEIYNTTENSWTASFSINHPRANFSSKILSDGSVILAGGNPSNNSSEFFDPSLQLWVDGSPLGLSRNGGTFLQAPFGQLLIVGGGAGPIEMADLANKNWSYLGAQLSNNNLMSSNSILLENGSAFLVENVYSDEIMMPKILTGLKPVEIKIQGASGNSTISVQGGGHYDAVSRLFYPPFEGNGSSTLKVVDDNGLSSSILLSYTNADPIPNAISATSSTDFSNFRVMPIMYAKMAKKLTVNLAFSGTRHATEVNASGLTGDFSFVGGNYPGTGGSCGIEISKNCTLVLQFFPTRLGMQNANLILNFKDGLQQKSTTISFSGNGEKIDPAQNVLVIYNSSVADSSIVKDYYIDHRPGMANANVLALTTTSSETINTNNYTTEIETPFLQWLQANPTKKVRYVIWMYGLPSRISGGAAGDPSVPVRLSQTLQTKGLASGISYAGSIYNQFNRESYPGTTALITSMNMGTVAATTAYIDKIVAMWNAMPNPDLIVSAYAAGLGGSKYIFEDAQGYAGYPLGQGFQNAMVNLNPMSDSTYYQQSHALVNQGVDISGYFSWGVHASLPSTYAVDGSVRFTGNSNWFLIATAESFNGQLGCPQGCTSNWFATNAWGGLNYSVTPAGAVGHLEEPYVSGINGPTYFAAWEAGFLFSEAAWLSRNTPYFIAVGDPLIMK